MFHDSNDVGDADASDRSAATGTDPKTIRHDWTQGGQPSVTVVEAVAAATDRATTELPPLLETIDSDALDTLLDGGSSSVFVSFRYAGTDVSVSGDGVIEVRADGGPVPGGDE